MTADAPTPDPVEARLRATLRAEADRHPTTPDLAALRDRADGTVIDLQDAPRRPRARLVALAAVAALVVAVVGAIALQPDGEDEPVLTDERPASGYYLPGAGWEVEEVHAQPTSPMPGNVRWVEYGAGVPEDVDRGTVSIFQLAIEGPMPDLLALAEEGELEDPDLVARGEGTEAREYVVSGLASWPDEEDDPAPAEGEVRADGGTLSAVRDDQVLLVDWYGPVDEDAVLAMADRWWTSGGEAIALDPATGLTRISDTSARHVEPVPADELAAFGVAEIDMADLYADSAPLIVVTARSPAGWRASYTLVPPGQPAPTGFDDADGGASAGLGPDEVATPLPASVGGPEPAWESGTGIGADVPGAALGIALVSYLTDPVTPEQARELWAALAPATRDEWVAAQPDEAAPQLDGGWSETLAGIDPRALVEGIEEGFDPEGPDTPDDDLLGEIVVDARDGVDPLEGRGPEEVDALVNEAVLGLLGGPGPIDADLFAAETAFGFQGEADVARVPIEDLAGGPTIPPDGEAVPPGQAAWNVLLAMVPAEAVRPAGADACPPLDQVAADPASVVLVRAAPGSDASRCEGWTALVVSLDDQRRIAGMEVRFG